jgi:hypothetical protein
MKRAILSLAAATIGSTAFAVAPLKPVLLLKIIGVLFGRKCRSCVRALAAPTSFLRTTPPLPQKKHKRDHEYAHDFEPLDLVTLQLEDERNHTQQPHNQGNHKRKQEEITPGHCDSPVRFPLLRSATSRVAPQQGLKENNTQGNDSAAAVAAFGGETKFMRAFQLDSLDTWHRSGVPPGHHLGLYRGLERRGYQVSPKLFGLTSWRKLPGV